MKGYKCDRCGVFFNESITDGNKGPLIGLSACNSSIHIDLCPVCAEVFDSWMNQGFTGKKPECVGYTTWKELSERINQQAWKDGVRIDPNLGYEAARKG